MISWRSAPDAATVIRKLALAPQTLIKFPRLGPRVEGFGDREVRRIIVGPYEMRYEVTKAAIIILRIWHGRENR